MEELRSLLGENTYRAFQDIASRDPDFFKREKADLEMMELLDESLDPEIIKIACINKLTGTLEKAVSLGYEFSEEEKEMLQ